MIEFRGEKYITVKEYVESNNKLTRAMLIYNSILNPIKYVSLDGNIITFRYNRKEEKYKRNWEDIFVKVK